MAHALVQMKGPAHGGYIGVCRCGWETPIVRDRDNVFVRLADHDFIARHGEDEWRRRCGPQSRAPLPWKPEP